MSLYSQVHGSAVAGTVPLLLIHGGGSTIETNWSALLPELTKTRQVVAVELQGHGRSPWTGGTVTFENSADDVAEVLRELDLGPVDVLGFSNGGNVALRLAMRHPGLIRRQIVASAFYRRDGLVDGFWDGMAQATLESMPQLYRDADAALNPDPAHQQQLFDLDSGQMKNFVDWPPNDLASITTPTLILAADRDVATNAHTVEMAALIPGARLMIVPGTHGDYLGEAMAAAGDLTAMHATLPWLLRFLA
ncbi:alpha/beta hydrolase [Actinoplanes sp. NBRC 103695]|uniref:alpha/beta fold hydrolase n=1 Tax=Actinoplanes sp. NBRC 103695 TaxID=3032202 RepID=UPI0024A34FF2|nr:alpha/beta hydrolase [Actinoplanes sp. NBRC 103695]GLZ01064.1 oxidoreductase [Actinoplanes sp. NBRC 103695]